MLFCRLLILKINFLKGILSVSVSNNLDPDHARHCVGPDLDPNCLQRLTADKSCSKRVNTFEITVSLKDSGGLWQTARARHSLVLLTLIHCSTVQKFLTSFFQ